MPKDCGPDVPGSTNLKYGSSQLQCVQEQDDCCILIFCEHKKGELQSRRYYRSRHSYLDLVQTRPEDEITIWTDDPEAPATLSVKRDGTSIDSISATARAGGKEYRLKTKYFPTASAYPINKSFFQSIFTYSLPPTIYRVSGLSRTLTFKSYNPDQWKLSISLPPMEKLSMGRVLDNKQDTRVTLQGKAASVEKKITGRRWEEYSRETWRTSDSIKIAESYSSYCKKLATPSLFSNAEQSRYQFSAKVEQQGVNVGKKILKSIRIERNSQSVVPDSLDVVLTVISLATNIIKIVKEFQDHVPKVGWYIDFQLSILQGTFELAWGWREFDDYRAYYYVGAGIKLKLFEIVFEIGLGVDVPAFKAQVCGQYKGDVSLTLGQFETTGPDIKASEVTLGDVTGAITGGFYARVVVGYFLNVEAGLDSGLQTNMKAVYSFSEGFFFEGENQWTGIKATYQVSTGFFGLGGTKNETATLVQPVSLSKFKFPAKQPPKSNELSRYEISKKMQVHLEKGWDIRVFKRNVTETVKKSLFGGSYIDRDVRDRYIGTSDVADIVSGKIFAQGHLIMLDDKTIEGICHSVRKKLEGLGERWGRDYVLFEQVEGYLNGTEFAEVLKMARDPVKVLKNS